MKYPKLSKHGIPHFAAFACIGDSVTWTPPKKNNPHGLILTATIVCDESTRPEDFDCYSAQKIKQWQDGDWDFIGIVLSVHKNRLTLDDHACSLWGIERNYNAKSNLYFAQVCKDMQEDALSRGHEAIRRLLGD